MAIIVSIPSPVEIDIVSTYIPEIAIVSMLVPNISIQAVVVTVVSTSVEPIRMVASLVVPTVPSRIAKEIIVVIQHGSASPIAAPRAPSPSATPSASALQRTERDASAKSNNSSSGDIPSGISRDYVRSAVDRSWIVLGNVHCLRICGFDHDRLGRLLNDRDLRTRLEVSCRLSLMAQGLDGCHYLRLLVVIGLPERARPVQVIRHVAQHGRKRRKSLHTWIPRLIVHSLH